MNLSTISSKSKLIFAVAAIAALAIFVVLIASFFARPKTQNNSEENLAFPTPAIESNYIAAPTEVPQAKAETVEQKKQLLLSKQISQNYGDITLAKTTNYEVKYVTSPDIFFVTIYSEPVEQNRNAATKWFQDQDINQEDLCLLNVRFRLATNELAKNNPSFSSLPSGC